MYFNSIENFLKTVGINKKKKICEIQYRNWEIYSTRYSDGNDSKSLR